MERYPLKRRVFTAALVVLSLGLSLGLTEVLLRARERAQIRRISDAKEAANVMPSDIPGLNYTLRPNHRHGDTQFNSHGFNMAERPVDKPPGLFRLFFVGDSVTQGVGTQATGEAFPNLVDAVLRAWSPPGRVEAWNAGTGGYNADQVFLMVQHVLPAFDPDAVIYVFNFNDYWEPNQYFHGQPAIPPGQSVEPGASGPLDRLKQFRTVLFARDIVNKAITRVRGYPPVYVDRKIGYPSWQHMKDVIVEMHRHCQSHDIPFAVVLHPNLQFLHRRIEGNHAHRDLAQHLAAHGIPKLELVEALRPHRGEPLYLPDGNHLKPAGHQLLAEEILRWLAGPARPFTLPAVPVAP
ncbi:MAG TPA: SGNH/GDSL hydrolase family protein [Kiritimatiellia bacterium]|nr:SGNH/GDSL hydrolase family protein [Kiritimatiellia bacterium]